MASAATKLPISVRVDHWSTEFGRSADRRFGSIVTTLVCSRWAKRRLFICGILAKLKAKKLQEMHGYRHKVPGLSAVWGFPSSKNRCMLPVALDRTSFIRFHLSREVPMFDSLDDQ